MPIDILFGSSRLRDAFALNATLTSESIDELVGCDEAA
jgi:hypothetical protein